MKYTFTLIWKSSNLSPEYLGKYIAATFFPQTMLLRLQPVKVK